MISGKRDSALLYAESRLSCWARWARDNKNSLGFPTISLLYKAMRQKSERIKALEQGRVTARGNETQSFTPNHIPEAPEAIAETDRIVAQLPRDLNAVIMADYFTYGPIEVRAGATPWRRARYCQLLEAAKYAVYVSLDSRT